MLFSTVDHFEKRREAELIVFPFWQRQKRNHEEAKPAAMLNAFEALAKPAVKSGDFHGNTGETLILYAKTGKEKRCLLLGLGKEEKLTVESLRKAYSNVAKECQRKAITKINLVVPTISELRSVTVEECLKGISEGILLTNYRWEKLASLDEETVLLRNVCLVGVHSSFLKLVKESEHIAEGVYLARDLINGNADIITPHYLAESARKISEKFSSVKATIFDRKRIEKENMGLLLAVSRGSAVEPAFIILSHRGSPGSKDHTVVVGKGITFDTGGLNIKTSNMETMRDDMSGAATALSTIAIAAALDLPVNVTAVVPSSENAIDANSYKPGDVYESYAGITVEIGNTDAEGRLILADALAYSVHALKPTRLIDFATLTGSMVVALGDSMSGLFCNDEYLARSLLDSSLRTSEILWRMPLFEPYTELLKSDVADIKNVGGRPAGAITAALFMQAFVQDVPWAHIDIAGTAFANKEKGYLPKNGVGFGVRLMVDFLQNLSKKF
jgi:leucyl aminopeptidase